MQQCVFVVVCYVQIGTPVHELLYDCNAVQAYCQLYGSDTASILQCMVQWKHQRMLEKRGSWRLAKSNAPPHEHKIKLVAKVR